VVRVWFVAAEVSSLPAAAAAVVARRTVGAFCATSIVCASRGGHLEQVLEREMPSLHRGFQLLKAGRLRVFLVKKMS